MPANTCVRCGTVTSPHDVVSVASGDGDFRSLCSRCFNTEMAHLAQLNAFEHPEFSPVCLADGDGAFHEFHFRSLLFGDQLSLSNWDPATKTVGVSVFSFSVIHSRIRSSYWEIWCRRSSVLWRPGTWPSMMAISR